MRLPFRCRRDGHRYLGQVVHWALGADLKKKKIVSTDGYEVLGLTVPPGEWRREEGGGRGEPAQKRVRYSYVYVSSPVWGECSAKEERPLRSAFCVSRLNRSLEDRRTTTTPLGNNRPNNADQVLGLLRSSS